MKVKNESIKKVAMHFSTVFILIISIFVIIFTIYIQQPDPIETNLITYAGRDTINVNNRYAFDLISWAPGYTDQAIIKIDNNTRENLNWNLSLEYNDNIPTELINSIEVYVKENPLGADVLKTYNSQITSGYTLLGNLSDLLNSNLYSGVLDSKNDTINLSILLHVKESSTIKEVPFSFRDFLKVNASSNTESITKIFK